MKRITSLVLSLIIALSLSSAVSADKTEYTRMEICTVVQEIFGVQPDGDILPLLAYNDWASLTGEDRYLAAAVVKSGIFAPDTASFDADEPMTRGDYDRLMFGINRYALSTPGYNFASGEVTTVNIKGITIVDSKGEEYKFSGGIPVIKGTAIDDTFSGISEGVTVQVVYNDEGEGVIAWVKSDHAPIVMEVQSASFYVGDLPNGRLVFTNPKVYKDDTWQPTNAPYLYGDICDETVVICADKKVEINESINSTRYLDRPAMVVVGEKNNTPCILYVLFD